MAIGIAELDGVVLQAPVVAFQGDNLVNLVQEIGDGWIVVELGHEDYSNLGQRMASHDQTEAETAGVSHRRDEAEATQPSA
jgi:hypothetical protein